MRCVESVLINLKRGESSAQKKPSSPVALIRTLVESHRGTIEVESDV
jgi:hypothetical protein